MSFFTALFSGHKKSAALLTPPDGMRETDIALESSTCTGETVIGFRSKADGHLLNAVVVRSRADIETFYKSYGLCTQANLINNPQTTLDILLTL